VPFRSGLGRPVDDPTSRDLWYLANRYLTAAVVVIPIGGALYYLLLNADSLRGARWVAIPVLIIGAVCLLSLLGMFVLSYLRFLDANRAEGGTLLKPAMQLGSRAGSQPIRLWQWIVLGAAVLVAILVVVIR
jgi:hypothetical protein